MRAVVGDRIVVHGQHLDMPEKHGQIVEVRHADGRPPYLVRWDDSHESLVFPGADAQIEHAGSGSD